VEQRFVPTLALVGALHPTGIVFEHFWGEGVIVAAFTANFLGKLGISVAKDNAQGRLCIACEAVELVAEALDVVHGVKDDDALLVYESLHVRFQ